jgi:hypothetical protein
MTRRVALAGLLALALVTPARADLSVTLLGTGTYGNISNNALSFALGSTSPHVSGNVFGLVFLGPATMEGVIDVTLSGTGTVTIIVNMNNIHSPLGGGTISETLKTASFSMGSGSFSYTTYGSQTNTQYTTVPVVSSPTVTSTGEVTTNGGSSSGAFTSVNPFSLTEVLTVTFTSAGKFSFDASANFNLPTAVPEPASVTLALTSLPAIGLFLARRRRCTIESPSDRRTLVNGLLRRWRFGWRVPCA